MLQAGNGIATDNIFEVILQMRGMSWRYALLFLFASPVINANTTSIVKSHSLYNNCTYDLTSDLNLKWRKIDQGSLRNYVAQLARNCGWK